MNLLSSEAKQRVEQAVREAESETGGEIITAIIPESDDYAAPELLFGIALGLLTYILLLIFAEPFSRFVDGLIWIDTVNLIPLSMLALTLLAGTLGYALAQIPCIDRIVIGRRRMAEAVHRRAMRYFTESAAYDTVDRTGVLLFISVLERRVELLADRGINVKVSPDTWENIVSDLVNGIRRKQTDTALETAIRRIGKVLAEFVPPRADDTNEKSDKPVELQKGS